MAFFYDFFWNNMYVVIFLYGLASFLMGFAIFLKNKEIRTFKIAGSLWLLGTFGLLHGIADWGHFFIPFQTGGASPGISYLFRSAQVVATGLSFAFLLQFGVDLIINLRAEGRRSPIFWLSPGLFLIWVAATWNWSVRMEWDAALRLADVLTRYLLAFPGAALAGWGFLLQLDDAETRGLPQARLPLRCSAFAFFTYAIAGGLLVPAASFPPANVVNQDWFFALTGVPVAVLRMASELTMAYFVIRILVIFDQENQRRLNELQRSRSILAERERISREIHDGVIQSLYAVGLNLENGIYLVDEDPQTAKEELARIMKRLDQVVDRMREYIMDLKAPLPGTQDLRERIHRLVREFQGHSKAAVEVDVPKVDGVRMSLEQQEHLLQILREAISNAVRHAEARVIRVEFKRSPQALVFSVRDDGHGFEPPVDGPVDTPLGGHGLSNMRERAHILGARIDINSRPGSGTEVALTFPSGGATDGRRENSGAGC